MPTQPLLTHEVERAQNAVLILPPFYPPYEDQIDMRLPMHFTHEDLIKGVVNVNLQKYIISKQVKKEVHDLLALAGIVGSINLARPRASPISDELGPMFLAVSVFREDLYKWHIVHREICEIISENYPDQDPPFAVRYLEAARVVDF